MPGWCEPSTGLPRSWKHYVYGIKLLGLRHLRWQRGMAEAVRMGGATADDYRGWNGQLDRWLTPRDE